jgi:membrane protein implicated in regulation of membrane protease activity
MTLTYWHWLIAGVVMLGLEMFLPGAVFLWLGVAACATGLLVFLIPGTLWQIQFVFFCVAAVASVLGWRQYRKRNPQHSDQPALNRRGEQFIGRTVSLEEPLVNGTGRVRLGDTMWKVSGPDLPAGTQVRITSVNGVVLVVEQVGA